MNPVKPFPPKPTLAEDFTKPVAWLLGRDLIEGLKWIVLYTVFKGKLDPRDWMSADVFPPELNAEGFWQACNDRNWEWKVEHDKFWARKNQEDKNFWTKGPHAEEFWFDFIADTGDGQISVYNVAYLCLSDVWTGKNPKRGSSVSFVEDSDHPELLPRGQFLFVGGDTTYHIADYASLSTRFQQPFRWAFTSVREWLQKEDRLTSPLREEGIIAESSSDTRAKLKCATPVDSEPRRPLFGIPGNHDYYDLIDGFNRQFRQPTVPEDGASGLRPQLSILGFRREQDASYVGLRLPFDWWFWGLDTEVSKLDVRQQSYFLSLIGGVPNKLILATPEPTTVFRERKMDDDKTLEAYAQLGLKQPYQAEDDKRPGICRLDLSGDVHHYARYYGPNEKALTDPKLHSDHYASLVAGGGGAFLHPTETVSRKGDSIEEQVLHPPANVSHAEVANRLFDLRNIWHGGYVWLIGLVIAWIVYFASTVPQSSKNFLEWLLISPSGAPRQLLGFLPPIPFRKESDYLWLDTLRFKEGIDLSGFRFATVLLIAAMACLVVAIVKFSKLVSQLANSPMIFDEDAQAQGGEGAILVEGSGSARATQSGTGPVLRPPDNLPTKYRDLKTIGFWVLLAIAFYVPGAGICAANADKLHPFGSSLLVVVHIILTIELLVLSVQNSAWLTHRPKFETGTKLRYLPVWALTALATLCVFFGIWVFGRYPGAYVLSDAIFALVAILVLFGLTFVGWKMGGELQKGPGKILMLLVGFWHGLLQLVVPLMLIRLGDWRAVVAAFVLIMVFSGISIPWTSIRVPGLGVWLMKRSESVSKIGLSFFFLVYGGVLLALPFIFHNRNIVWIPGTSAAYSTFLPNKVVQLVLLWFPGYSAAWALLIISMVAVVAFGFLLSMSFLSWYFAVSLAFQGHNNEVGGAARIEKFKHIVRLRVRKDDLTAYVIGIDNPEADGYKSRPKLIDVFTLRVT